MYVNAKKEVYQNKKSVVIYPSLFFQPLMPFSSGKPKRRGLAYLYFDIIKKTNGLKMTKLDFGSK